MASHIIRGFNFDFGACNTVYLSTSSPDHPLSSNVGIHFHELVPPNSMAGGKWPTYAHMYASTR
jgi:hypothetical protein